MVTLLIGSFHWADVQLAAVTERGVDLPLPSTANGRDEGLLDVEVVAGMRKNPEADANIAGGRSLWGDSDGDGKADIGGDSVVGQGHEHVLFKQSHPMVPVYHAPAHLLPLTDTGTAENTGSSVFTHAVAAVAIARNRDFSKSCSNLVIEPRWNNNICSVLTNLHYFLTSALPRSPRRLDRGLGLCAALHLAAAAGEAAPARTVLGLVRDALAHRGLLARQPAAGALGGRPGKEYTLNMHSHFRIRENLSS